MALDISTSETALLPDLTGLTKASLPEVDALLVAAIAALRARVVQEGKISAAALERDAKGALVRKAGIMGVVIAGGPSVYLEITAVPAHRIPYVIAPVVANQTSLPAASPAPAAPATPALAAPQSS